MLSSNKSGMCEDISLLNDPEYCDVKIESSDGLTIPANKTVLAARSQYFRGYFTNLESHTGRVEMPFTKHVLDKLIVYLHSGEADCESLELGQLLELMDLLTQVGLSTERTSLENHVMKNIDEENYFLSDCLKGLRTSHQRDLKTIELKLLAYLGDSLPWISQMDEVGSLSKPLVMRLLQEKEKEPSQTIHRFRVLNTWLSVNSADGSMIDEAHQMFDLEHFTAAELATDVKRSGLFWSSQIIDRLAEICQEKDDELENLRAEKDKKITEVLTEQKSSRNVEGRCV